MTDSQQLRVTDGCELLCAGNQTQVLLFFVVVLVFCFVFNLRFSVCVGGVFCMYVCVPHACSAHAGHKRAVILLELESQRLESL